MPDSLSRPALALSVMLVAWLAAARPAAAQSANAPFEPGSLIVTEFFEDLYKIDPATGGKTHLAPGMFDGRDLLEIDSVKNLITIDATNQLVRFNPTTLAITPLASQSFVGAVDLAIEPSGSILVVSQSDVFRVDPTTGQVTTLVNHLNVNGGFFGPSGIAVGPTGRIFVTEFFEHLWEINPASGAASQMPLSREIPHANDVKVRTDGDLIVREANTSLLRISAATGAVSDFWYGLPGFPEDFALEADDDVILTSSLGLFHYDADTGQQSPLTKVLAGEFFAPKAVAIVPGGAAPSDLAGDFDEDGDVDADDLGRWKASVGLVDSAYDGSHFLAWQRQLGAASPTAAAVPEPAAIVLVAALAPLVAASRPLLACSRRRRAIC